ncbi:hypothetical protein GCM10010435_32540 [Winogradskya consettensis]|uniref:Gram-positive cocci surface proteins LPxTG domain-containing protein n=1 Tax=Winogradskya consettensis TaxID=113560 RepID=A0A919SE61_9ACTN|nr:LPXTG cell wall anchor domain-containing protein [Actinoplanes consettensis]GIM70186.1 hypothetical protein Aco04nite_18950 [Actinoplanes consettensis]
MKNGFIYRAAAGLAALAAAVAAVPVVAYAAPAKGALEDATEYSVESGKPEGSSMRAGYVSRAVIGVRNRGTTAIPGLVVEINLRDENLRFPRKYDNCVFTTDGSAWCEFADTIAAGQVLALKGPVYGAVPEPDPAHRTKSTFFDWSSKEWADSKGGLEALAGADAVRGDQGTLVLEPGSPRIGSSISEGIIHNGVGPATGPTPTALPPIPPSGPDSAELLAMHEKKSQNDNPRWSYNVGPGQPLPGTLGVRNLGSETVHGLVLDVRLSDNGLKFIRLGDNCWFTLEEKPDSAWCSFDTDLAPGATLRVDGAIGTTVAPYLVGDYGKDLRFHWVSKEWADDKGGIAKLAGIDAIENTTATKGTAAAFTLTSGAADLVGTVSRSTGFVMLFWPPTPDPPSSSPTTSPAPAPGGGGDDGEAGGSLPITGSRTVVVAGAGVLLVIAGLAGFVLARRRRTRFSA